MINIKNRLNYGIHKVVDAWHGPLWYKETTLKMLRTLHKSGEDLNGNYTEGVLYNKFPNGVFPGAFHASLAGLVISGNQVTSGHVYNEYSVLNSPFNLNGNDEPDIREHIYE